MMELLLLKNNNVTTVVECCGIEKEDFHFAWMVHLICEIETCVQEFRSCSENTSSEVMLILSGRFFT